MIARIPIDSLDPAPYNPRRISDKALKGLAAGIKRYSSSMVGAKGKGYRLQTTITVNEDGNRVVGGHQLTGKVPKLESGKRFPTTAGD